MVFDATNPLFGRPSVSVGVDIPVLVSTPNTCKDQEDTGYAEGAARTNKCILALEGSPWNPLAMSAVPIKLTVNRGLDGNANTKELTITLEHAGPRLTGVNFQNWWQQN